MRGIFRTCVGVVLMAAVSGALAADAPRSAVPVEASKSLPRPDQPGLGTMAYKATEQEKSFLAKVTEVVPNLWGDADDAPPAATAPRTQPAGGAKAKPYTLAGQAGNYVGWFGIVRSMKWDETAKTTTLLLQHCYFDGFTDTHMQVVSIYGAGDFSVTLPQKLDGVERLSLMRVYGKASVDAAGKPLVTPEYVRTWAWGQFTFMNYGEDHSNPEWVKLLKVDGLDVYKPYPDTAFYEERLGKR